MEWSSHAKKRWDKRFSHIDFKHEYYMARVATQGEKKKIAMLCKKHSEYFGNGFLGIYYMITRDVIFVIAAPENLVTVFPNELKTISLKAIKRKKHNETVG